MNARPPGRAGGHGYDLRRSPVKEWSFLNKFWDRDLFQRMFSFPTEQRLYLHIAITKNIVEKDSNMILD